MNKLGLGEYSLNKTDTVSQITSTAVLCTKKGLF